MNKPNISFVCCVESGGLEDQAIRMITSLRKWGGQFADAPVFAVTPRLGPPLSAKTLQIFKKYDVKHLHVNKKLEYDWFPYTNKPRSLVIAEPYITTELVGYLDADLLILKEPDQFILQEGEDFAACVTDAIGGSTGPESPLEGYWQDICNTLRVNINDLPWATTEQERQKIRIHWNGGVFVYRRSTNFANNYLQATIQVLNSHVSSKVCGIFFNEQVAMAVAVIKMGLNWRNLPLSHNYEMNSNTDYLYSEEKLKSAHILHYHDCMWSSFWDEFVKRLNVTHPQVADWLSPIGPMQDKPSLTYAVVNKVLRFVRNQRKASYVKVCRLAVQFGLMLIPCEFVYESYETEIQRKSLTNLSGLQRS